MMTRHEELEIGVDGESLAAMLAAPSTKMPGVLFVHGWGGSQERDFARARDIAALGCVCLTFDMRGHGATLSQQESVTREQNLRDVLAAYETCSRVSARSTGRPSKSWAAAMADICPQS